MLALRAVLTIFGKRILTFWVCEFGLNVNKWVVFLVLKEPEAWPKRLPDEYGHGIWTGRGLRDHLIQPFQADAETSEPEGVT